MAIMLKTALENDRWIVGSKTMAIQTRTQTSYVSTSKEIKDLYPNLERWLSRLPEDYRKITLQDCKELPQKMLAFGQEWVNSFPPKSLYLYGDYGSGKTTFAFALIRELLKKLSGRAYFSPNYLTGRQLDSILLKAVRDGGDEWELEKYSDSDLLFIDDIDKVTSTDRFKVQLFEIINRRLVKNKPTIITSNNQPTDIGHLIDGAVISRMADIRKWQMINFPKKDLRQLKSLSF